ncbi:MAG: SdrD B-like domain-containing protein [Chloroflexota bacterium]
MKYPLLCFLLSTILLASCAPSTGVPVQTPTESSTPTAALPSPTPSKTPLPEFPAAVNPLTGLAVEDPGLLDIPALLISISHFPATARPQAGLSFAPFVYEIYITEGATRFLTVFYGEYPTPEVPLTGDCIVRGEPFTRTGIILGNRVWLDKNANGQYEAWEVGVGGVCVNLLDAATGETVQQTTSDSNGFYGFNALPGEYVIEFVKPRGWTFTAQDADDDQTDSDADASTGRTGQTSVLDADDLSLDAGLIPPPKLPTPEPESVPRAWVGPVRSGRLIYADLAAFYEKSCLIYAYASEEVLVHLPKCAFVEHLISGGGYMLERDRMIAIAEDHAREQGSDFNYVSNIYDETPPAAPGLPALQIKLYFAWQHQSGWAYDPLYQSWHRYVDDSTKGNAGILHAEVDRLTGRQLHFENIVLLFTTHDVVSPTNLDIHLEANLTGRAILFRDGQKYDIFWSTLLDEGEKSSGRRHPIQFLDQDGYPIALRPGHTWVTVLTPDTTVEETSPGVWQVRFVQPPGAK